jgi:hypothetical protein
VGTLAAVSLLVAWAASARGDEPLPPPPPDEFLIVPLRVHVLTSRELPDADCGLSDDDLKRVLDKVNRIWHQAGIHFGIEPILREQATGVGRFRMVRALSDGEAPLGAYRQLLPSRNPAQGALHVYFLHELPVNGVYLGEGLALVKETAHLREVAGGVDEPLPRVTSHELGHALGLAHCSGQSRLLASGTTGFVLAPEEVKRAREEASKWGGRRAADAAAWADRMAADGDAERAALVRMWLSQIRDVRLESNQPKEPDSTR